jgi:hypothetical protein
MAGYTRLLECLSCSNNRSFVRHGETEQQMLSQAEAAALPRGTFITCGRCGSSSLITVWGDAIPYATTGYVGRRRRRRSSKNAAQAAAS